MTLEITREIRKALVRIAESNRTEMGTAARIVLALSSGKDDQQISSAVTLPLNEVRYWRTRFEEEGLSIFRAVLPADLFPVEASPPSIDTDTVDIYDAEEEDLFTDIPNQSLSAPDGEKPTSNKRKTYMTARPITRKAQMQRRQREKAPSDVEEAVEIIETSPAVESNTQFIDQSTAPDKDLSQSTPDELDVLIAEYHLPLPQKAITSRDLAIACQIDLDHAQHISKMSIEFFDETLKLHRLPQHYRLLLDAAALLLNVAYRISPENHHILGRDLILKYNLKDVSPEERQIIASIVAFHHLPPRPHHDVAYMNLPMELRKDTQTLAAIMRIAVGLDYSRSQTSHIVHWQYTPGEMILVINGRESSIDAARATQKSDLWNRLFSASQIRILTLEQATLADFLGEMDNQFLDFPSQILPQHAAHLLRDHYAQRFEIIAQQIISQDARLIAPLWREFQRLTGIGVWFIPATVYQQNLKDDIEWFTRIVYSALQYATLAERSQGVLNETDPTKDDPTAITSLTVVCTHYNQLADDAFHYLQQQLQSSRYEQWLQAIKTYQESDSPAALPFGPLVAQQAWSYMHEIRQILHHISWERQQQTNRPFLINVKTIQTFEVYIRHLTDILIYSASLLGTEFEQALDILNPILEFTRTWQRLEYVAQYTATDWEKVKNNAIEAPKALAMEALTYIMRQRADNLREKMTDMWQLLDTTNFRRALALAIINP